MFAVKFKIFDVGETIHIIYLFLFIVGTQAELETYKKRTKELEERLYEKTFQNQMLQVSMLRYLDLEFFSLDTSRLYIFPVLLFHYFT